MDNTNTVQDILQELKSLRRKEMKVYYQKQLPATARLKVSTFLGIGIYILIRFWEMSLGLTLILCTLDIIVSIWWLFSAIEFLVYTVQLNIIKDKIDIIRTKLNNI
jgi:hypothetical protein